MNFENLRKFVAPEFVFGNGSRFLTTHYLNNLQIHNPLIVTDSGVIAAQWPAQVIDTLKNEGMSYSVFSNLTPNPKDFEIMAGAEVFHEKSCDAIIAIGGGSSIDCAKGIGIIAANSGCIQDFEGVDKIPVPCPPLICIPTTAGSAADVSQFAIITNTKHQNKMAIISKLLVPDVSLLDPEVTCSMDSSLTAATGIDTFVHAIEAFVSNASSPFTDLHAREAIRLVCENLKKVMENPYNKDYRARMMCATLLAGLAFSNASLGAIHAMAHSLGGLRDIPHGLCNAILLPYVVDYNFTAASHKYRQAGQIMGVDIKGLKDKESKDAVLFAIRKMLKSVGINQKLGELGIQKDDIPKLAKKAIHAPCILTNPCEPELADLEKIYEQAL